MAETLEETEMEYMSSQCIYNESDDLSHSVENNTKAPSYKRFLPRRASKSSCLNKVANKTIKKPEKRMKDKLNLKPAQIKQLYSKQNLTNFKSTKLETIFEDIDEEDESEMDHNIEESNRQKTEGDKAKVFGNKKLKRTITFGDGFNVNKTIVKKRRSRIRHFLGKKRPFKKIPLPDFFEQLKKYSEDAELVKTSVDDKAKTESTDLSFTADIIKEKTKADQIQEGIDPDSIDENIEPDSIDEKIKPDLNEKKVAVNPIEVKFEPDPIGEKIETDATFKINETDQIEKIETNQIVAVNPIELKFEADPVGEKLETDATFKINETDQIEKIEIENSVEFDQIDEIDEADRLSGNIEEAPKYENFEADPIDEHFEVDPIDESVETDTTDQKIEIDADPNDEHIVAHPNNVNNGAKISKSFVDSADTNKNDEISSVNALINSDDIVTKNIQTTSLSLISTSSLIEGS